MSRIVMMPRIPPVSTTHSFGDIATATRMESIENAEVHELDANDRGPERAHPEPFGWLWAGRAKSPGRYDSGSARTPGYNR